MRLLTILVVTAIASPAVAYDSFSETRSPTRFSLIGAHGLSLVLKGNLRLSWRDLEGEGGAGKDSVTDTATLGTRSAHAVMEAARVALRLESRDGLGLYTSLYFSTERTWLESAWLNVALPLDSGFRLHLEAGLHTPFVATDYRTHRGPLAERIYWGGSEARITAQLNAQVSWFRWWVGLSGAMMRPLETYRINDAATRKGTLAVLSYGNAEPFAGNQPVGGLLVGLGVAGASLELFGYLGKLSAERGTDELRNRMAHFELLPGFDSDTPRAQDTTFWWAGGRLAVEWHGAEMILEAIESAESLLRRSLQTAQLGYIVSVSDEFTAPLRTVEVRLRGERYRILDAGKPLAPSASLRMADPSQALTWDWDVLTAALALEFYARLVRLTVEYSVIWEHNGADSLSRATVNYANNEWVAGLEFRF